jgi:beta-glucosidase
MKNKIIKSVAVIDPNANEAQLGIYAGFSNVHVSPLERIKEKVAALRIKVELKIRWTAKNDVVVLFIVTSPEISIEELDRTNNELPPVQQDLIKAITSFNINIVFVFINGSLIALALTKKKAKKLVEAWYDHEFGGITITNVLSGDVNSGVKLPETFYTSTKELPSISNYDLIDYSNAYIYFNVPVLYPFGYGLSCTKFKFGNFYLKSDNIKKDGDVEAGFKVQNPGKMKGEEVVRVYLHNDNASIKVFINQLKRSQRITLVPRERKTLSFKIPPVGIFFLQHRYKRFKNRFGKIENLCGSSCKDINLNKL